MGFHMPVGASSVKLTGTHAASTPRERLTSGASSMHGGLETNTRRFDIGEAHMALAKVLLLGGRPEEAIPALEATAESSDRKGNLVTAEKARAQLASLKPTRSTDVSP